MTRNCVNGLVVAFKRCARPASIIVQRFGVKEDLRPSSMLANNTLSVSEYKRLRGRQLGCSGTSTKQSQRSKPRKAIHCTRIHKRALPAPELSALAVSPIFRHRVGDRCWRISFCHRIVHGYGTISQPNPDFGNFLSLSDRSSASA